MEASEQKVTEVVEKNVVTVATQQQPSDKKSNIIQVSSNKRPLYFYVNLAKRHIQNYNEVELSALGMAIGTVVTVAEILKNTGFATEKKIQMSTVDMKDQAKGGKLVRKAKIEITLGKSEGFDKLVSPKKKDQNKIVMVAPNHVEVNA
ncbi:hypothetical protein LUZ63_005632 [Rhynchospora breviuscula]|uniref:DNA/RNA-binding protein Alba-like domain-containing protein n=1 Tax=Rhynchospora breviuscula TaxID=2022672 RepID=A0A9Q0CND2_9POAL|nr:hypothetical protein LUZ63_005632 [Rhynchospora breviuscula]